MVPTVTNQRATVDAVGGDVVLACAKHRNGGARKHSPNNAVELQMLLRHASRNDDFVPCAQTNNFSGLHNSNNISYGKPS